MKLGFEPRAPYHYETSVFKTDAISQTLPLHQKFCDSFVYVTTKLYQLRQSFKRMTTFFNSHLRWRNTLLGQLQNVLKFRKVSRIESVIALMAMIQLLTFGSSRWDRTIDTRINSPLLLPLSYRGIIWHSYRDLNPSFQRERLAS